MAKWPTCAGVLKSGEPCRSVVIPDEDGQPGKYCSHHSKTVAEVTISTSAAENPAATEPTVPLLAESDSVAAGIDAEPAEPAESASEGPPEPEGAPEAVPIASLRAAIRGDLSTSAVADLIGEMLLDALRASKDVYSTCPKCHNRHPVSLPDLSTRMKAAQSLLEEVEGRLAQASKSDDGDLSAILAQTRFESLSDSELSLYLAADGEEYAGLHARARELAEQVLAQPADPFEARDALRIELEERAKGAQV